MEREDAPVTLNAICKAILGWLPPVYLLAGWAVSGLYVFHYTRAVAAIGIVSGIAIFVHYNVMIRSNIVDERKSIDLDRTAKIALVLASLGFCVVFLYLMTASWTAYKAYAAAPLLGVGMVYVPAFSLGVASAAYVKLIAVHVSKLKG